MAFTSLWLQSVLGLGPIAAGAVFLPLSLASLVCSILAGRVLHDRVAPGLVIGGGLALVGVGSALQALVGSDSSWPILIPGLIVMGIGVGFVMPTLSAAATASAPRERGGMAGGAVTTFRQLGLVLGIAVLGGVFAGRVENVVRGQLPDAHGVADLLTGGQARAVTGSAPAGQRGAVDDLVHAAFASGLRWSFVLCAAVAFLGAVLTIVMTRKPATAPEPAPAAV
jgi:MFS family permease